MKDKVIAVDIGATKILSGVVTRDGRILTRVKEPTLPHREVVDIIDNIEETIKNILTGIDREDILAVAVATPGPLDYYNGIVQDSPNLHWQEVHLRQELNQRLGYKLVLDKDTNMAALGELYFGNSKGCQHLIYITVSTGIGGGVILDGSLYHGKNGGAGEIGHMVVDPGGRKCGCGRNGCIEALASGTALATQASELISRGQGRGILEHCQPGIPVTAKEIGEAARQGDTEALRIINRAAEYIGIGISNLVNILNPERIILGGSVACGLQDLLIEPITAYVFNNAFKLHCRELSIEITSLGEDIGLLGCTAAANLDDRRR